MKAVLRRGRARDAAGLLALEAHFPSDRMSPRSVRAFLASPRAQVWVVDGSERLLGSLILLTRKSGRAGRIYSLVVSPEARGLGLAQRMVRAAEVWARRQGLEAVRLEVREDNRAARALYAKLGYASICRLPQYYEDGADGLRLARPLG